MRNTEVNNQGRIVDDPVTSHNNETASVNPTQRCGFCGRASARRYCDQVCYTSWRQQQPLGPRFWSKVHKTPSCWLWTGAKGNNFGHGSISVRQPDGTNRPVYAHRVAWELANGPIPDSLQVLHNCPGGDNPRCVNPAHLFLGTQADNLKDAAAKERFHVPRPNHPRRKLSEADVTRIHEMRRSGMTLLAIGEQFGVTKAAISQIVNGKRRVYTAPQLNPVVQKGAA